MENTAPLFLVWQQSQAGLIDFTEFPANIKAETCPFLVCGIEGFENGVGGVIGDACPKILYFQPGMIGGTDTCP